MPRLEFLLKLIPSCISSSSSSSATSESTALPLEVVIFRVHVIVDSFRDFLKVCRKSRVGGGLRLNLRVNNQQVGSGVFFLPPIGDPHTVNQPSEDPHGVNNQSLNIINNQVLHVVNNQTLHFVNNQVLPVVNNQVLPVVNNQVLPVVNNEPSKNDNNNQVLPVVNNQPKNDNNNQVHPVVNNQVHPVVNNQVLPLVNTQLLPPVNTQLLPLVNTQLLPPVNTQSPKKEIQFLPLVNTQSPKNEIQLLPLVNTQSPKKEIQLPPLVNTQSPKKEIQLLPPVNTQLLPLVNTQSPKNEIQEPNLVRSVRSSLHDTNGVLLCKEGVGGTYQVNYQQQPIAIFKPIDEEPGSPNNPKKFLEKPLLPPGGGACREVAAFLLDHNRAGVPETHMVHGLYHERFSYSDRIFPKTGSLQKFVQNIGNSLSMSSSRFTVEDVHNIGILDLRLLNLDRNGENLLIRKEGDGYRLVPIDHAYTLPDKLDNVWVEWLHWRQAKVPFSPDVMEFVDNLDPESDARILSGIGISPECIRNMKLATCLLKKGVSAGLTLFEIASMICRKKQSEESELEKAVARAWNYFPTEIDRNNPPKEFEWRFEEIVCEVVEKRKNEIKVPF